jgi:glycosyltransferase involved in cell wall biosynthesis
MKASVVVPAYNEERLLAGALESIRAAAGAFDRAGWSWDLIVCDNNSSDRTAEIAAAAGADVVFEPVNQIGRARNTGAAHASGDWLFFVDADSYPSLELMTDAVRAIGTGQCLAGGATLAIDRREVEGGPEGPPVRSVEVIGLRATLAVWNGLSRAARWAAGSFMFCEAETFRRIGGFSSSLYIAEEIELFRRLKKVARRERRRIIILDEHPMLTSGRKAHLYTSRDVLRFYARVIGTGGRALRTREGAFFWYDGRR